MKKQKAKKAQADKKETKDNSQAEEAAATKDDSKPDGNVAGEEVEIQTEEKATEDVPIAEDALPEQNASTGDTGVAEADDATETQDTIAQEVSSSEQSRIRSESFKRGTSQTTAPATGLKLGPMSPGGDAITDIYKKQAARIEQLEKDSKRLEKEAEEKDIVFKKVEREVEELREAQADSADLRSKAGQMKEKDVELQNLVSSRCRRVGAYYIYR